MMMMMMIKVHHGDNVKNQIIIIIFKINNDHKININQV